VREQAWRRRTILFVFNDIWKGEDGIVPEYLKDPHGVDRGARGGEGGGKSS
jgi:hypothetical protein